MFLKNLDYMLSRAGGEKKAIINFFKVLKYQHISLILSLLQFFFKRITFRSKKLGRK